MRLTGSAVETDWFLLTRWKLSGVVVVIDLVDGGVVQHVQLVQVGQLALVPGPGPGGHLDTPGQLGAVIQLLELPTCPASLGDFLLFLHGAATTSAQLRHDM